MLLVLLIQELHNMADNDPQNRERFGEKRISGFKGLEFPQIRDLFDKDPFIIQHTLVSTTAATAGNYTPFWIAPFKCEVVKIQEVHVVKGSDGSDVTLQVERLQGTETSGSGDDLLTTAFDLKETNLTVQTGTLVKTNVRALNKDDRLGLVDTGTLTAVDNVTVVISLIPIGQGSFRKI